MDKTYTPFYKIKTNEKVNIAGVVVDYCDIHNTKNFSFKLMDLNGDKIEIGHIIKKRVILPEFKSIFQLIFIYDIQFERESNGSLLGSLDSNAKYEIIASDGPKYSSEILKVEEAYSLDETLSSSSSEPQQIAKKRRYDNQIEEEESDEESSAEIFNQPMHENNAFASSRFPLLNVLSDIRIGETYQLILHVLKIKRRFRNHCEFIATDYSSKPSFKKYNTELVGLTLPKGKYYLKLIAWDNQVEDVVNAMNSNNKKPVFFRFTAVKAAVDEFENLELVINTGENTRRRNHTEVIPEHENECREILERRASLLRKTDK